MTGYAVAFFASLSETTVTRRVLTWDKLVARLQDVRTLPEKGAAPLWSATDYPEGATRGLASVRAVTLAVLDYDDGTPLEAALEAWPGTALVLHTSWTHTPEHPRFRVVLQLAEPVPAQDWTAAWRRIVAVSPGTPDPACKDASRAWYLPACPEDRLASFRAIVREGEPLNVAALPEVAIPGGRGPLQSRRAPDPHHPQRRTTGARERALRAILATDPERRERAALLLGATVTGDGAHQRAEDARCPRCGDSSVWWPIKPERIVSAMCHHRNSCGWSGSILDLLNDAGWT